MRIMDCQRKVPFKLGQEVEAKFNQCGYRGAWFRCRIKEIKDWQGGLRCLLEYLDFTDEDPSWAKARQALPSVKSGPWLKGRNPLFWMIRPQAPPVIQESDLEKYKEEVMNKQKEPGLVAIFNNEYMVGDMVDWWKDDCFWSGRITEVYSETNKVKLVLPPPPLGEGEVSVVSREDIRPSFSWSRKKRWRVVPPKVGKGEMAKTKSEKSRVQLVHLCGDSGVPLALEHCQALNAANLPSTSPSKDTCAHPEDLSWEVDTGSHSIPARSASNNCNNSEQAVIGVNPDSSFAKVIEFDANDISSSDKHGNTFRMRARRGERSKKTFTGRGRRRSVCSTASFCLSDSEEERPRELSSKSKLPQSATLFCLSSDEEGSKGCVHESPLVATNQQNENFESQISQLDEELSVGDAEVLQMPAVENIIDTKPLLDGFCINGNKVDCSMDYMGRGKGDDLGPLTARENFTSPPSESQVNSCGPNIEDLSTLHSSLESGPVGSRSSKSTSGISDSQHSTKDSIVSGAAEVLKFAVAELQVSAISPMEVAVEPLEVVVIASASTDELKNTESLCSSQLIAEDSGVSVFEVGVSKMKALDNEVVPLVEYASCDDKVAGLEDMISPCCTVHDTECPDRKQHYVSTMVVSDKVGVRGEVVMPCQTSVGLKNSEIPASNQPEQLIETLQASLAEEQKLKFDGSAVRRFNLLVSHLKIKKAGELWRKRRRVVCEGEKLGPKQKRARSVGSEERMNMNQIVGGRFVRYAVPSSGPATPVYIENRDSLPGSCCKWDVLADEQEIVSYKGEDPQLVVGLQIEGGKDEITGTLHQQMLTFVESEEEPGRCLPIVSDTFEGHVPMEVDNSAAPSSKETLCQPDGTTTDLACIDNDLDAELDTLERLTERIHDLKVQLQGCQVRKQTGVWKVIDRNLNASSEVDGASMQGSVNDRICSNMDQTSQEVACLDSASVIGKNSPLVAVQGAQEDITLEAVSRKSSVDLQLSCKSTSKKSFIPDERKLKRLESSEKGRSEAELNFRPEANCSQILGPDAVDGFLGPIVLQEEPANRVREEKVPVKATNRNCYLKRKRVAGKKLEVDGTRTEAPDAKEPLPVLPEHILEYPSALIELPRMRGSIKHQLQKLMTTKPQSSKERSWNNILRNPDMDRKKKHKGIALIKDPVAFEQERINGKCFTGPEKQVFWNKYALYGKNFRVIASCLKDRSTSDCVEFYYRNKVSEGLRIEGQVHTDGCTKIRESERMTLGKEAFLVRPVPESDEHLESNAVRPKASLLPSIDTEEVNQEVGKLTEKGLENVLQLLQNSEKCMSLKGLKAESQPASNSKQVLETGSRAFNDKTDGLKIKLQSNGNWSIKDESEEKPIWVGYYLTKEAALSAYEGYTLAMQARNATLTQHTSPLPPRYKIACTKLRDLQIGRMEAKQAILVTDLSYLDTKVGNGLVTKLEGCEVSKPSPIEGKEKDVSNLPKILGTVEYGLDVVTSGMDANMNCKDTAVSSSQVQKFLQGFQEKHILCSLNEGHATNFCKIPRTGSKHTVEQEQLPPVSTGVVLKANKDADEISSDHEKPSVSVVEQEEPAAIGLEKVNLDAENCSSSSNSQGVQDCVPGDVKEQIDVHAAFLRCNETRRENFTQHNDNLPASKVLTIPGTLLDCLILKNLKTAEEQEAARCASLTLLQKVDKSLASSMVLQDQGLIDRLKVLSKMQYCVDADGNDKKVVIRTPNLKEEINLGRFRTDLEVEAVFDVFSQWKKFLKKTILSFKLADCLVPTALQPEVPQVAPLSIKVVDGVSVCKSITSHDAPHPSRCSQVLSSGDASHPEGPYPKSADNQASKTQFSAGSAFKLQHAVSSSAQQMGSEKNIFADRGSLKENSPQDIRREDCQTSSTAERGSPVNVIILDDDDDDKYDVTLLQLGPSNLPLMKTGGPCNAASLQGQTVGCSLVNHPLSVQRSNAPQATCSTTNLGQLSTICPDPPLLHVLSRTSLESTALPSVGGGQPAVHAVLGTHDGLVYRDSIATETQQRVPSHLEILQWNAIQNPESSLISCPFESQVRGNVRGNAATMQMPVQNQIEHQRQRHCTQVWERRWVSTDCNISSAGHQQIAVGPVGGYRATDVGQVGGPRPVGLSLCSHGRPVGLDCAQCAPQATGSSMRTVLVSESGNLVTEVGCGIMNTPSLIINPPVQTFSTRRRFYNCCMGTEASALDHMLIRALQCEQCEWLMHTECAIRTCQLAIKRLHDKGQEQEQVVYVCYCGKSWGVLPLMLARLIILLQLISKQQAHIIEMHIRDPHSGHLVTLTTTVEYLYLKEALCRLQKMLEPTRSQVIKGIIHNLITQMMVKILTNVDRVNFSVWTDKINKAMLLITGK